MVLTPQLPAMCVMPLLLYAHPFSSYCQKVLIALYENGTTFELKMLGPETPENFTELARLWPLKKFPVLVDNGQTILESSVIIEHLALHHTGPVVLLPTDPKTTLAVRMLDRVFDTTIMTPMQRIVANALRPEDKRDPYGVTEARAMLETAYAWLDQTLAGRTWAVGDDFTLADCAAAPALFYADWSHEIPPHHRHLKAYRARLLARPSVARAVDEARPYRAFFPLGAPDRD
jgi:glutathione S-transferase